MPLSLAGFQLIMLCIVITSAKHLPAQGPRQLVGLLTLLRQTDQEVCVGLGQCVGIFSRVSSDGEDECSHLLKEGRGEKTILDVSTSNIPCQPLMQLMLLPQAGNCIDGTLRRVSFPHAV